VGVEDLLFIMLAIEIWGVEWGGTEDGNEKWGG
jgi:hypothetical protein